MFVLIYFKYKKKYKRIKLPRFKSFCALIFEKNGEKQITAFYIINFFLYTKILVETQLLSFKQFKFASKLDETRQKRNGTTQQCDEIILFYFCLVLLTQI